MWQGFNALRAYRKEARDRAEKLSQDRADAFNQAYNSLSDRYFVFLGALAQCPHIGVQPWTEAPSSLSAEDQSRRSVLYDMVISLCEDAYLITERSGDIKLHQWPGWEEYIIALLRRDEFRQYLDLDRGDGGYGGFDSRFETYLKGLIAERGIGKAIAAAD